MKNSRRVSPQEEGDIEEVSDSYLCILLLESQHLNSAILMRLSVRSPAANNDEENAAPCNNGRMHQAVVLSA